MIQSIIREKEVLIMSQTYTPELKKKIIRHHLEDGRTIKSIVSEFGVFKTTISKWCHEFSEEFRTSPEKKKNLILCESVHVTQSISKVGCPYDNAPMERYFNTLKNECTNLYEFQTKESLYRIVE